MSKASVRVVSGAGGKAPARFLVDTGGTRLMLNLGYGPQPGLCPDVSGKVDALLLTHSHRDHAGGLSLAKHIGDPPVVATAPVLAALGRDLPELRLALQGERSVHGIRVRTGRNGHAPGGVWLHLDIGDGLLYTGDYSVESPIYAYDAPPEAATVILDASYGVYDHTLDDGERHLLTVIDREPLLLPVPVGGRGPEIAYYLAHTRDTLPHLGADLRKAMMDLATGPARESLRPDSAAARCAGSARHRQARERDTRGKHRCSRRHQRGIGGPLGALA